MDLLSKYRDPSLLDLLDDLPEHIQMMLAGKNLLTIEKISKTSNMDFLKFGLTEDEIDLVKSTVAVHVPNTAYLTVLEYSSILATKWKHITFGCKALDQITRNGLPIRGITEIAGESGCGKTQMCLQLSLNVQLPLSDGGLDKSAVYICTENAFPSKRLVQMAHFFRKQYQVDNVLDHIFVEYCHDSAKLISCISSRLPILMEKHSIGLIVIDSIAGVFRVDQDAITRAENMRKLVLILQTLADEHETAVVCVNQVTASMNEQLRDKCVPSLGLAWSNLVTTQIKIRKLNKQITTINESQVIKTPINVRSLQVNFSPELPNSLAEFIITENGICDLPNNL